MTQFMEPSWVIDGCLPKLAENIILYDMMYRILGESVSRGGCLLKLAENIIYIIILYDNSL